MAGFVCTLCGRCCMGMGRYIKITGQIGQGRYAAHHELSDETFYPSVMKPYRDVFSPFDSEKSKEWCPFLLEEDKSGNYVCVIHDTLPSFCRNFKCCLYRIYDSGNYCLGEVKGRTTLISDDEGLNKIWNDEIMTFPLEDNSLWKKNLLSVLEKNGYIVEDYE